MALSRWNVENFTVVASALVAKVRQTRPVQTRVPDTGVQVRVLPAHFVVLNVRDEIWETRRIQVPVPEAGRAGSTLTHKPRAVGEIVYHSWLLPMNSGFESRTAYKPQAPLAELG